MDAITAWLNMQAYMPHGHCFLWQPSLVGLHRQTPSPDCRSALATANCRKASAPSLAQSWRVTPAAQRRIDRPSANCTRPRATNLDGDRAGVRIHTPAVLPQAGTARR